LLRYGPFQVAEPEGCIGGGALALSAAADGINCTFNTLSSALQFATTGTGGGRLLVNAAECATNVIAPGPSPATAARAADAAGGAARGLPNFTFRGDSRSPNEIFGNGFQPRGNSNNLFLHALDNKRPPSNFVSTSRSPDVASDFGNNVFVVRPRNGVDVNQSLGPRSPFPDELEVAIPNGVDPRDIRAVTLNDQGISILNPNFQR